MERMPEETRPSVSVIVPVRNEESSIATCLDAIESQTFRDMEILVIDGMSTDSTISIVQEHMLRDPRIRLIPNEQRVTPVALNLGLADARGTFLVRIDAHSVVSVDYVERIVQYLETGQYAGVGGTKIAIGGASVISQVIAQALSSRFGVGGSSYHYANESACVDHIPFGAYRVDLLRELGGWNPSLLANEDFELDYRVGQAGGRLLLDPSIRINWKSSQTLRDLSRQYQRYGRGKAAVARLHPHSLKLRHLFPVAALLTVSGSLMSMVAFRRTRIMLVNAPYVVFLAASYVDGPLRRSSGRSPWLVPVVLVTMEMSWALGFLRALWEPQSLSSATDPYHWRNLSQDIPS
jgi:succinoglycan biosynthesis protein ExoA